MSITLRFNGPPSPGYADDGETWVEDLGYASTLAGRRVTSGEAVTLDGDGWSLVKQDPDATAVQGWDPAGGRAGLTAVSSYQPDAILIDSPDGQRLALPRTLWSADGEATAVDNIRDVLARVGDDPDRARAELAAEQARGDAARVTLVRDLEKIAAGPTPTPDNAGAPDDTTTEG